MKKPCIIFVLVVITTAIAVPEAAEGQAPRHSIVHSGHVLSIDSDLRFGRVDKAVEELENWVDQLDEELHPHHITSRLDDMELEIGNLQLDEKLHAQSELQSRIGYLESTVSDLKDAAELQANQIADLESQIRDLQKKKPR